MHIHIKDASNTFEERKKTVPIFIRCIFISRMQVTQLQKENGSLHIAVKNFTDCFQATVDST